MIIETKEATVESSVDFGDSVDMGIAADGVIHLMSLLTNLYNDPELAVIREYYTNALDAHTAVDQLREVEVYLPTFSNPLYVVKDYGIGMSRDDIQKIYAQYGASTKRNTNKQVGAFGLGCKSALTIATQFTLTSVKNGKKTTALISKSDSGVNKVDIMPVRDSAEPNGTTVTIPVPNVESFRTKAQKFFQFTETGKVKVDGLVPESIYSMSTKLITSETDFSTYIRPVKNADYWNREDVKFHMVMGGVPYELSNDEVYSAMGRRGVREFDLTDAGISVVFVVDIGSVDLTPSREGLRFTDKTNDFVDRLVEVWVTQIRETAQAEVDAVEDRGGIHKVYTKWKGVLRTKTWRGEDILDEVRLTDMFPFMIRDYDATRHTHAMVLRLDDQTLKVIVTGVDVKEYRKVGQYLGSYCAARGFGGYVRAFFVDDLAAAGLDTPWVTDNSKVTVVSEDDFKDAAKQYRKEQRALNKTSTPKDKLEYPVLDLNTCKVKEIPYDEIESDLPYIMQSDFEVDSLMYRLIKTHYNTSNAKALAKHLRRLTAHDRVILVESPRKGPALEKRVKGSFSLLPEYHKLFGDLKKFLVRPGVQDILALESRNSDYKTLMRCLSESGLDSNISDPDLRRLISPKRKDRILAKKARVLMNHLNAAPKDFTEEYRHMAKDANSSDLALRLKQKYPLVDHVYFSAKNTEVIRHLGMYLEKASESLTQDA